MAERKKCVNCLKETMSLYNSHCFTCWSCGTHRQRERIAELEAENKMLYNYLEHGTVGRTSVHRDYQGRGWLVCVNGIYDPVPPKGEKQGDLTIHKTFREAFARAMELSKEQADG